MLADHEVGAKINDVTAELLQAGTGKRMSVRAGVNQHDK
jgi:hypothetical protein